MFEKLLEDVQDKNTSLSNLLRRAKLLANRMEETEFLEWIDLELEGYRTKEECPKYRNLHGEVKAWNPYHGWVPVVFGKSSDVENIFSNRPTYQSVNEIEELLEGDSKDFHISFPDNIAQQLLSGNQIQTKVSLVVSRPELVGVLNSVRNKLFDWILKFDKAGFSDESLPVYEGYNQQNMLLLFANKEIELSKKNNETDAVKLMKTLSKEPARYWYNDEIYEDWEALKQDVSENKNYHAARKINELVKGVTGTEDFILYTMTKFRINPKYLKSS
jgi:hypothetical protein